MINIAKRTAWNKGLKGVFSNPIKDKTYEEVYGIKKANELKRKIGSKSVGRNIKRCPKCNVFMGIKTHDCKEIANKISKSNKTISDITWAMRRWFKGRRLVNRSRFEKGHISWSKDKTSEEDSRIRSKAQINTWNGGSSFEPYGLEFNNKLKEFIRKRDGYACQECGYLQENLGYKLNVHHIDYNKQNNNPENLISLCNACHGQTNFDRDDWTNYFQDKMVEDNDT